MDNFLIFLTTIIVTRLYLAPRPKPSPTIKGFRLHHYMYGIVLITIGLLIKNNPTYLIGLGLFIDELGFVLIGGETHQDYWSKKSLLLLTLFIIIIYFLKKPLMI